jgi:hypothetical protein
MAIVGKKLDKREIGIGFGRVLTVLMTMPAELLAKVIERSEQETLHSPEQQELRAKRLQALKKGL